MKTSLLSQRFTDLAEQAKKVLATKHYVNDGYSKGDYVEDLLLIAWKVKAKNLISKACGADSHHFLEFEKNETGFYSTSHSNMLNMKAVFDAAREDYDGGYCNTVRNIVQAEVFGSELEQASELLSAGYLSAAAVIAGVVLETTLRGLCEKLNLSTGKLDRMNADLAKAGHYNQLVAKRITALAQIRNDAAHGNPDKFTRDDVRDMIAYIEGFVGDQL